MMPEHIEPTHESQSPGANIRAALKVLPSLNGESELENRNSREQTDENWNRPL
jgi:hypothetical protein